MAKADAETRNVMHTVQPTTEGRFAVVSPDGEQLHESPDQYTAERWAEACNSAPIIDLALVNETQSPMGIETRGRWADRRAA